MNCAMMSYGLAYTKVTGFTGWFSRVIVPFRKTELDVMLEYVKACGAKRVIDFGCNTGHFAYKLKKTLGIDVHGCDINIHALKYAMKKYPDIPFHTIDERFLDKYSGKFDAVILSHVLEHIHDRESTLLSIRQILSNNGMLIIAVPQERIRGDASVPQILLNLFTLRFENPHVVKIGINDLVNLFRKTGFELDKKIYTNYFWPRKSNRLLPHAWSLVTTAKKTTDF